MRRKAWLAALCALWLPCFCLATSLPTGLSGTEVDRIVEIVGVGGNARLLRSAEPYIGFPGIKFGLEMVLISTKDINDLGDLNGSTPGILPTPRLYIAKGLFYNLELILNIFPSGTISSFSGILKWTYWREAERWLSGAFYVGLSSIRGFEGSFSGSNIELGSMLSKDYVRFKPYLGLGVLFASGSVNPSLAKTEKNSGSHSTMHGFIGAEWELPVNLTAQVDLFNLAPGASLFIGKKF